MTFDLENEMTMDDDTEPAAMLGHAEQVQTRIRRAGRWYPAMMISYGLMTIGIVAWVPVLNGTWAAITFGLVAVAWGVGSFWWKSRHDV
ncbi:MAG: hypothetical protein ACR2P2_13365, partial [Nakamurella sp.]